MKCIPRFKKSRFGGADSYSKFVAYVPNETRKFSAHRPRNEWAKQADRFCKSFSVKISIAVPIEAHQLVLI